MYHPDDLINSSEYFLGFSFSFISFCPPLLESDGVLRNGFFLTFFFPLLHTYVIHTRSEKTRYATNQKKKGPKTKATFLPSGLCKPELQKKKNICVFFKSGIRITMTYIYRTSGENRYIWHLVVLSFLSHIFYIYLFIYSVYLSCFLSVFGEKR